jgi:hypothetical protein
MVGEQATRTLFLLLLLLSWGMFSLSLLWFWLNLTSAISSSTICPRGFANIFNQNCYKYSNLLTTWDGADAACRMANSWLVTVSSLDEHNFLIQSYGIGDYWIGLNANAHSGTYLWTNGEPVTFTKWARGQPDSSGDCVYFWQNSAGSWDDVGCDNKKPFVCETYSLTSSPTQQPTLNPTLFPSPLPSLRPSFSPTVPEPTSTPSISLLPTSNVTDTIDTTASPTFNPSISPTNLPSLEPLSSEPSSSPSSTPTGLQCAVDFPQYLGDGYCDFDTPGTETSYNTAACDWDGGDCCSSSCVTAEFACGVNGYRCLDPHPKSPSPSSFPTPRPSQAASLPPSRSPTQPTTIPTQRPTSPTNTPTRRPSKSPTGSPTFRPTSSPTIAPTSLTSNTLFNTRDDQKLPISKYSKV